MPGSWIFQSSPDYFDARKAVGAAQQLSWLVQQFENEIHRGDRVYVWETGPAAGFIAVGTVTTDPAVIEAPSGERLFERDPAKFAGPKRRVMISIDKLVEPPLTRSEIRRNNVLATLPNL